MTKDKCLCTIHGMDTINTIEGLKMAISNRDINISDRFLQDLDKNIKSIEKDCGAKMTPIYTDIASMRNELDLEDFNQAMFNSQSIIELIKEELKKCI